MKLQLFSILLTGCAAFAQLPAPHPAFDKDAVHEIRLHFENADWFEVLTANYDGVKADNPYFPASLEWGSFKFEKIGVRFKGNSSYNTASGKKKPFRIKLNEFVKGQKIEGIGSFGLSNAWNDPSFVREKPYYELAASMGLVAPRSNFAALYINDVYWGLYILGETINEDFMKNHLGKGEDTGNIYKANLGASFDYLGEDKAAYKSVWEKQSNEDADDWTDLIALCKLINDTPAEELRAKLSPIMDVDSVLAALALDNATVNLDSYVGMGQNFNIYRRPSDGRWVWIPWDPSLAFGGLSQGLTTEAMQQLTIEWVNAGGFGGGGAPGGVPGGTTPPDGTFPTPPDGTFPTPPGGTFPPPPGGTFPMPPGGTSPTPPGGTPPTGPGGGAGGPVAGGRPLATKLWASPEYKERYRQIYRQLVEKVFLAEATVDRMSALRELIRPWVEKDTQKLVTLAQFESAMTSDMSAAAPGGAGPADAGGPRGGGMNAAPGLQPFITSRLASIQTQLAASAIPVMAIVADKTSLGFTLAAGGSAAAQKVSLSLNGSSVPADYSLTITTESGGTWLSTSPAGGPVGGSFSVAVSAGKLEPGVYAGKIEVRSAGASNSPVTIVVSMTLTR